MTRLPLSFTKQLSAVLSALMLFFAGFATAQPQASAQWQVADNGMTLQIRSTATTADLDAACKATAGATNIQFDFNNKSIDSLAPIAQLKGLKIFRTFSLDASKKAPLDVTPLAGLTELEDLDLYGTHVTNSPALAALKKLKRLSFYSSDVESLECVKGMPNLQELNLYGFGHTFPDYTPLTGLKKLRNLDIYMNRQATDKLLAPLAALTSLDSIHMSNDREVTSLDFLKGSKDMENIDAGWCSSLKDISACQNMDQLEGLNLDSSAVTDISPLAGRIYLRRLNLARTKVSDLKPLEKCGGLDSLDITGTPVQDLTPLAKCRKLKELRISRTVPQAQVDALLEARPRVKVQVQP